MTRHPESRPDSAEPTGLFPATSWQTIYEARRSGESATQAMERLLLRYYPAIERVVALKRRRGGEDAREITHDFIASCLRRDFLREVGPEKGRFRVYLNRCLVNFLRDKESHRTAQKRGNGVAPVSLDAVDQEGQASVEVAGPSSDPGLNLDREWAARVVDLAMEALERECRQARRAALFRMVRGYLTGREEAADIGRIARDLGASEGAVHVALHRLRRRFGELVIEEVKAGIMEETDWRQELKYLLDLVSVSPEL